MAGWQKSNHSQNTGDCVEVGHLANWRKSSYSHPNGNCVEVGELAGGTAVRDTKDRDGGYFVTTPRAVVGLRRRHQGWALRELTSPPGAKGS
ncbi:DUF397 domain-containing protein [Saccharopolyspora sp. NPDC000359]|uniref:DUF397 domain-containing protein n=1 Tax=Saccharopolyspora sp. NPDC000359 TaxID=3154251 RepID=UPI00332CDC91